MIQLVAWLMLALLSSFSLSKKGQPKPKRSLTNSVPNQTPNWAPRLIALLRIFGAQNPCNLVTILNKICIFRGAQLYVPELFYAECANVLWQYVRRANYPPDKAKASLARLRALTLQTVAIQEVVSEALEIAIAHNISAYDACYVELSERLQLPLVTADQKLIRALASTTYQIQALVD